MRPLLLVALACVALTACKKNNGGDDDGDDGDDTATIDAPPGTIDAPPGTPPDAGPLACKPVQGTPTLDAVTVASGLDMPVFATAPTGDPRLFILEKLTGDIKILKNGQVLATPFLTIDVVNGSSLDDERGLLGLAFAPDYAKSGTFYVFYMNNSGDHQIDRYQVSANADIADADSRQTVWTLDDIAGNHNGGTLAFSPIDGYLYFGVGDGGNSNDSPQNYGQNINVLFGKINRIDVSTQPYTSPATNPYAGATAGSDEIWSYGWRNPYRWSFDRQTGDMYLGDVGQGSWEEIDVEPAGTSGRNYGWRVMEGTHCFNPMSGCDMSGKQLPVYEHSQNDGSCAIIGGYVYRGCSMPGWHGNYFFADYCSGFVKSFQWDGAGSYTNLVDQNGLEGGGDIVAFGEDGQGELYIVRQDTGIIQKIVPE
jgi:glucose/arabinose dehydrogenase